LNEARIKEKAPLFGRIALVTGAGRGIGRVVAVALAKAGADLVLVARTAAELGETRRQVEAVGRRAVAVAADVSCREQASGAAAQGVEQFGRLDVLVNCAGCQGPIGPLWENEPEEWCRAIQVNLLGTFYCTQAVLPGMIARRQGKIINFSGGGATSPRPNFSSYAVSKAAVVRLTETLAEELRAYNVQVNAVAPGAVNTRMLEEVLAAGEAAGAELAAARRRQIEGGTPAELAAELIVFLASDASGGLAGKLISAPHDAWRSWSESELKALGGSAWLTLRRMDEHTLRPLLEALQAMETMPG
jgi:3-oxoacyl-[acyl-carrier protein] reductase